MDRERLELRGEFVTLGQLLKIWNVAETGGAARFVLEDSDVRVNGERETRRGRKLFAGDVVSLPKQLVDGGLEIEIVGAGQG